MGIRDFASVRRWMESIDHMYRLSSQEWEMRLSVLREFCQFMGKNPDEVIAEARERREAKLDYMRQLRAFHCGSH